MGVQVTAARHRARSRDARWPRRLTSAAPNGRNVKPLPVISAPSPLKKIVKTNEPAADASATSHRPVQVARLKASAASGIVARFFPIQITPPTATIAMIRGNETLARIWPLRSPREYAAGVPSAADTASSNASADAS